MKNSKIITEIEWKQIEKECMDLDTDEKLIIAKYNLILRLLE